MNTISIELARELIDFAPTERAKKMGYGESQLQGTVAAFNMVARNGVAYIADEVGMGKTYVALGVLGIMRHLAPDTSVMVIAPRENIQRKWIKELQNFVRGNWRLDDGRVRTIQKRPVYAAIPCDSLEDLARESRLNEHRDFFLRMSSFSITTKEGDSRRRYRERLYPLLPPVAGELLAVGRDPDLFRDNFGKALNAVLPDIDLLIVDEAHNLKHGFGPNVSNRNRVLGFALGHPEAMSSRYPWYGRRVRHLLLLSATPFEYDYGDIWRQLDVLGLADSAIVDASGKNPLSLKRLAASDVSEDEKKEIVQRMLLRRAQFLNIGGRNYSKNMYRREWRGGGLESHDIPMHFTDPKQRLIVGLIQKKVAEILGNKRFNNSFQIGMLSSFESFLQTMAHRRKTDEQVFDDADQGDTSQERRGVDSDSLTRVISSYRNQFGEPPPHPKLDATAKALEVAFETGNKSLVFCRRIATVWEMKEKLDRRFDEWLRQRIVQAVPQLAADFEHLFTRYEEDRRKAEQGTTSPIVPGLPVEPGRDLVDEDQDQGGIDTFFAWFFRGETGPKGWLSGATFEKNRISNPSAVYSTLFEDDHVAWLLGRPENPLAALAKALGRDPDELTQALRRQAYAFFHRKSRRKEGYPRRYVFESYQTAALKVLAESATAYASQAEIILHERYTPADVPPIDAPEGFPGPASVIGATTFFTALAQDPALQASIWPESQKTDLRERFREHEQRRDLISALARLGLSYVDLFLLAIRSLSSLRMGQHSTGDDGAAQRGHDLANGFVALLKTQSQQPGFNAFYEMSQASDAFDLLLAVNFPETHRLPLSEIATLFARTLQKQMPIGAMSGAVNRRLVQQFRMPGFPLVLITTDVLQEGEDLHTFCRRVLHYGISWTPSAMEQRTGRIDRIGSLVQRTLDGRAEPPTEEELLQVYYPYLLDTVEVLQVRRVFDRLNRFLHLIHRTRPDKTTGDSRVHIEDEILRVQKQVSVIKEFLESAFPVREEWLHGSVGPEAVVLGHVEALEKLLAQHWEALVRDYGVKEIRTATDGRRTGTVYLLDGHVVAPAKHPNAHLAPHMVEIELRSEPVGGSVLLHCASPVCHLDLKDPGNVDQLYELQRDYGMIKVAARFHHRDDRHMLTVEEDHLFSRGTEHINEVAAVVVRIVESAHRLENELGSADEGLQVSSEEEGATTDA